MPCYSAHPSRSALDASDIDSQLSDIRLALEELSAEASRRTVRLLRRRNTLAAIHKLPVELILKIFMRVLEVDGCAWSGQAYYLRLHDLAQVATEWSQIVKNFPDFWTVIDTSVHYTLVKAALARSKDLPVTVVSQDVGFGDSNPGWSTVLRHIRRWNAVEITRNRIDDLEALLKVLYEHGGAANLRRLRVKSDADATRAVSVIFGGDMPHFRRIELGGIIFVAWSPELLNRLEWLSLENIHATVDVPMTLEQTLDLLRDCKRITFFRLSDVHFRDNTLRTAVSSIHLDTLTELNLEAIHPTSTYHILSSLRLPRCTSYRVCPSGTENVGLILDALAACATRSVALALENADYLSLEVSDEKPWYLHPTQKQAVQFEIWPRTQSDRRFIMELGGLPVVGFTGWLTGESFQEILAVTPIDLTFNGRSLIVSEEDILCILERLSSVTFLALSNLSYDIDDILLRFCNPQLAEPGPFQWLLPNLQDLDIHGMSLNDILLLEIARQRARGRSRCTEYGLPSPASLRRLSLWPMTRDTHHRFLKVIEGDVLKFWDEAGALIESNAVGFRA